MNLLDPRRRAQIVAALVEGHSVRSTSSTTRAAKGTVLKLLGDLGAACRAYHDKNVRGLPCKRIQCEALGASHDASDEDIPGSRRESSTAGSRWTWTALCADTNLLAAFHVGARDSACARELVSDVAGRLTSPVQLTTDGRKVYLSAVEDGSGGDLDHALLVELYGAKRAGGARHSPEKGHGSRKDLEHAVALHVMHHNFVTIDPALGVTPAMAVGVADRPWSIDDLVALLPEPSVAAWGSRKAAAAEPLKDKGSARESVGMLPAETSTFFARGADLADLRCRFEAGARLVTVGGPPGVGKTRLVRRYGQLDTEAAGGTGVVRFCEVSNAHEPVRLVAEIARAIGLHLSSSKTLDAAVEQLGHALAARGNILLILDNFDALAAEAAPILTRLLAFAPSLRLLVSSREPVHLDGEKRLVLGPLDTDDAVALFEDRARDKGAVLTASDRPVVRELVRRLDCLPLAVELAAARANVLSPQRLIERLSARLDLLVQTRRDAPLRHAGLRAAIDSSWELLTPEERDVFVELSVFRGGCSLEAAELVVSVCKPSVIDLLQSLVEKSLVTGTRSTVDVGVRFSLLDTLREYAEEKLDAPRREELERRHAEWCVRMAEPLAEATMGTSGPEALARLSLESDNLVAALRNMAGRSPELVARAALALEALLTVRAPLPLREALLFEALDGVGTDVVERGRLLCARSYALRQAGRIEEARSDLREAQTFALAGTELEADVELGLSHCALPDHRLDDARVHSAKAMKIYRARGHRAGVARAMIPICKLTFIEGKYGEVIDRSRALLVDARAIGDLWLQAQALHEMGRAQMELGCAEDAASALTEAGAIYSRLEDPRGDIRVQSTLGNLWLDLGRLSEARAAFERARVQTRAYGAIFSEGVSELNLGLVALDAGAAEEARTPLLRAMALIDGGGFAVSGTLARTLLAAADACTDRLPDAESGFADARARFEALGEQRYSIVAHVLEGLLDFARATEAERAGDIAAAEQWRQRARGRLEIPPDTPSSVDLRVARRVLERALALPGTTTATEAPSTVVRVAVDGRWFQLPGGPRVDLSRGPLLRKLLYTLAEQRLRAPNQALSTPDLISQMWPGKKLVSRSGPMRLYTVLATLRRLGLRELLLTRGGGYLLDPHVPLEWDTAPAPDRTPGSE